MILDCLTGLEQYVELHPRFRKTFEFISNSNLERLAPGRHEIDNSNIFAIAAKDLARSRENAPLEAHRKYIDIQIVLAGTDEMGWKSRHSCTQLNVPYNPNDDIEFFADSPDAWVTVQAGCFAIFFPDDTHAPLVGNGEIHKIVVKVAVD